MTDIQSLGHFKDLRKVVDFRITRLMMDAQHQKKAVTFRAAFSQIPSRRARDPVKASANLECLEGLDESVRSYYESHALPLSPPLPSRLREIAPSN